MQEINVGYQRENVLIISGDFENMNMKTRSQKM